MCQTREKHPGKFEGETCITRFAYYYVGLGDGLEDENDSRCIVLKGPFSYSEIGKYQNDMRDYICPDCWRDILNAKAIHQWEDSQGFEYSEVD